MINLGKTYAKLRIFPKTFFVNRAPVLSSNVMYTVLRTFSVYRTVSYCSVSD